MKNDKKKVTPFTFEIEGGGDLNTSQLPRAVRAAVDVLKSVADGKLLRIRALADRVGVSAETFDRHSSHPALLDYKFQSKGRIVYFGNTKTITAARDQFSL
jgi:hypothetical protein